MTELYENISHMMRGAALMFYLILSLSLYRERGKSRIKKALFYSMTLLTFLVLKDTVFLHTKLYSSEYVTSLTMLTDLLYVPAMAMFFFEAVFPGWGNIRKAVFLFLPIAGAEILYAISAEPLIPKLTMIYAILFGTTVTAIIVISVRKRDSRIKDNFSNITDISVTWVKNGILALLVSLLSWFCLMWKSSWIADSVYYVVSISAWSYIYRLAIRHRVVEIPEIRTVRQTESAPENSEIPDIFKERLSACMETDELYLNPKLTLTELAAAIGTNRTYLSDYLNSRLGVTFYEYINRLRTQKAARLMEECPGKPIAEIAEMSGFNSLSTFSRSFSKYLGCSPAKYARKFTR